MEGSVKEIEASFLYYVKKMANYEEALALIGWDLRTWGTEKRRRKTFRGNR